MCICYLQEFLAEYTNWKYQIKWKGFCYGMIWNKFNVSNEINKISTWNKIDTYITIFGTTYIHVHVWKLIVKKKPYFSEGKFKYAYNMYIDYI